MFTVFRLQRSEKIFTNKKLHKANRHSEIKRAHRRIKDAEKMLNDAPKGGSVDTIFDTVAEQVTRLCQQLMQIPMTFSRDANIGIRSRTLSPAYNDNSDHSDSDSSEKDTNGSNSHVRPRANADSRVEETVISKRCTSPSIDISRFKVSLQDNGNHKRSGNNNDSYQNRSYIDQFEAIGYIPNDSESSDGSFRGDSPGPLRGFPLSVQRRPSSAGHVERHKLSRGRSSSLPLLNGRRCYTPTLSSNGALIASNGLQMFSRRAALNGVANGSSKANAYGKKNLSSDLHSSSPLALKDRPVAHKSLFARHSNKDEILTSYQRKVENLVKRHPTVEVHIKDGPSSSEGSDSLENVCSQLLDNASFRNENESKARVVEETNVKSDKNEYALDNANQRLTPKRLLPKVPSKKNQSQRRHSDAMNEKTLANQNTTDEFVQHHAIQSHLRYTSEESKPSCTIKMPIDTQISQEDDFSPCSFDDGYTIIYKTEESEDKFGHFVNKDQRHFKAQVVEGTKLQKGSNLCAKNERSILNKDSFDIEEIKFKENVRTARREIIDKLRSKYALPRHDQDPTSEEVTAATKQKSSVPVDMPSVGQLADNKETVATESTFDMQIKLDKVSEDPKRTITPERIATHVQVGNTTEHNSPVMSIAGLKRYKSTTNLSKLDSFDNALSKFDDAKNKEDNSYRTETNKTKFEQTKNERKFLHTPGRNGDNSDASSDTNGTNTFAVKENLSTSLTYERNSPILSIAPLDRQGLLRSASVENVDSYQFLDTFGSETTVETLSITLKESGISTMSFNDVSLNESQSLKADDFGESSGSKEPSDRVTMRSTSSDNGFDSNEGLGSSGDSLDDFIGDRNDKIHSDTLPPTVSPHLYPAKLVVIDKHNHGPTSQGDDTAKTESNKLQLSTGKCFESELKSQEKLKQSNVKDTIDKLENAIFSRSRPEKRTLKHFKEHSIDRKIYLRSRSVSASRYPALTDSDSNPPSARALHPRGRYGSASETCETKSSLFSSVKKSRSIEADLNKICQEETAESIRREWIQRRSASISTPRKLTPALPTPECTRSIFKRSKSYLLPSRYLRSHISGIISLQNGRFVVVDELQMCLFFVASDFRILHESSLEYMPSGICITGSNSFAVAFPYKSLIRVFYIVKDRVSHTREIVIKCTEWITDIKQRKGRIHVLCKAGHIHILGITGREEGMIDSGITGKLLINEAGNRFYIHGERTITRINDKGEVIWTKSGINASCMMLFNDKLYIDECEKKRILTMSEIGDTRDLLSSVSGPVSAVCFTHNADALYVCQYSDEMDDESTRRINVYRK